MTLLDQRNKMIEEMVTDVYNWSEGKLISWSQEQLEGLLSHMSPEELQTEYDNFKEAQNE